MFLLPSTINLAGAEVELVNEMARENRFERVHWVRITWSLRIIFGLNLPTFPWFVND